MSEITITYVGPMPQHNGSNPVADIHSFVPCLQAARGEEVVLKAWVQLTGYAATLAIARIAHIGGVEDGSDEVLNQLLIRYGVRRLEALVKDIVSRGEDADAEVQTWTLTEKDNAELLTLWPLANDKVCDYQRRVGRDLYCLTPSPHDETAVRLAEGYAAAPTSRPICRDCDLPDTDVMCSHLTHPKVSGVSTMGGTSRTVSGALCDLGKPDVNSPSNCRAGGHACWQRLVEVDIVPPAPLSPLELPESFDVLDAMWRLAFGKAKHLLSLTTISGPAALTIGCSTRAEFESRLSALADVLDKLRIDPSLLPPGLDTDEINGSLDALERCLLHQLPHEHHPAVTKAVRTLRDVRQARNAIQHTITRGGGLTAKLRDLGIHDAPPNWASAWDTVRVQTTNALTMLRQVLREWIDSTS